MKYIKSSGGYYYKELSNGKRSRVSAEEYNTKKQKFLSKQGGGTGSGPYMREYEHMQAMAEQERLKRERLKTLTPEQIYAEKERKEIEETRASLKRKKDSVIIEKLIEEFKKKKPEKGTFFSTKKKLVEVMYGIILKAKNKNIEKSLLIQKMFQEIRNKYTDRERSIINIDLQNYIRQQPQSEPPKFPIIYLGDLFDSSCKANNYNDNKCNQQNILEKFSFNIRNIKYLKENLDKFQIFLGNRDINKLKLLELLKFEDETDWNTILNENNIVDAANKLVNTLNNSQPPAEETVAAQWKYNNNQEWDKGGFKPYWNNTEKNKEKWKNWEDTFEIKTCDQMFDRIFGADPKTGTMSADLLKDSIYNEITQLDSSGEQSPQSEPDLSEFKSAVALVVFKLLMMKKNDTIGNNNISYKLKQFVNDYSFVDLLLQNNVHFCKAIDNGNNILCFSHSGIQENIMTTDEFNNIQITEEYKIKNDNDPKITGTPSTVKNVNDLNEHLKKELKELINSTDDDISEKIYKFLYISAPFKQKSPIVVDDYMNFIIDHKRQITVKGKNTIQFTGHQPVGIATLFNISNRDNNKDNYNMVFSIDRYNNVDNIDNFKEQYQTHSSILSLEGSKNINLKTDIKFGNKVEIYNYEKYINEKYINELNKEKLISIGDIKIDNQIDLNNNHLEYNNQKCKLTNLKDKNIMGIDEGNRLYQSSNTGDGGGFKKLLGSKKFKCTDKLSNQNGGGFFSSTLTEFEKRITKNENYFLSDLEGLSLEEEVKKINNSSNEQEGGSIIKKELKSEVKENLKLNKNINKSLKNINNLQKNFDTTLIKINEIIDNNQQGFNTLDENNNYKKVFGSIKEKKEKLVNSHTEANKELLNEFKKKEFKEYESAYKQERGENLDKGDLEYLSDLYIFYYDKRYLQITDKLNDSFNQKRKKTKEQYRKSLNIKDKVDYNRDRIIVFNDYLEEVIINVKIEFGIDVKSDFKNVDFQTEIAALIEDIPPNSYLDIFKKRKDKLESINELNKNFLKYETQLENKSKELINILRKTTNDKDADIISRKQNLKQEIEDKQINFNNSKINIVGFTLVEKDSKVYVKKTIEEGLKKINKAKTNYLNDINENTQDIENLNDKIKNIEKDIQEMKDTKKKTSEDNIKNFVKLKEDKAKLNNDIQEITDRLRKRSSEQGFRKLIRKITLSSSDKTLEKNQTRLAIILESLEKGIPIENVEQERKRKETESNISMKSKKFKLEKEEENLKTIAEKNRSDAEKEIRRKEENRNGGAKNPNGDENTKLITDTNSYIDEQRKELTQTRERIEELNKNIKEEKENFRGLDNKITGLEKILSKNNIGEQHIDDFNRIIDELREKNKAFTDLEKIITEGDLIKYEKTKKSNAKKTKKDSLKKISKDELEEKNKLFQEFNIELKNLDDKFEAIILKKGRLPIRLTQLQTEFIKLQKFIKEYSKVSSKQQKVNQKFLKKNNEQIIIKINQIQENVNKLIQIKDDKLMKDSENKIETILTKIKDDYLKIINQNKKENFKVELLNEFFITEENIIINLKKIYNFYVDRYIQSNNANYDDKLSNISGKLKLLYDSYIIDEFGKINDIYNAKLQQIENANAEKAAEEQKIINNAAAEEQKERNAVAEEKERNAAEADMKLRKNTKEFKQKLEQNKKQNEILNKKQVRIRQGVANNLANKLLKEK